MKYNGIIMAIILFATHEKWFNKNLKRQTIISGEFNP